jgi:hypothetical protein
LLGAGVAADADAPPRADGCLPDDELDLVFLHAQCHAARGSEAADAAGNAQAEAAFEEAVAGVEWLDGLVRALNRQPGFREAVLLAVALGPGDAGVAAKVLRHGGGPVLHEAADAAAWQAVKRPVQSFEFQGVRRASVSSHELVLLVQRLPGVIR